MAEGIDNNDLTIKQSIGIVGIVLLCSIFFGVLSLLFKNLIGEELSILLSYVLGMGVPLLFVYRKRVNSAVLGTYNFNFGNWKMLLMLSVAVIAIQLGIISPICDQLPMTEFMKEILLGIGKHKGVFSYIMIVIAAPILEELIFRGIILDGLLRKYSPIKSIIISSVLFGIMHLNPWQFVAAFIIGLFTGWIYYRTQKLTLTIWIHMVNNLFAFISMYFIDVEAMMNLSVAEVYGSMANYILITITAIIIAVTTTALIIRDLSNSELVNWQHVTK